MTKGLIFIKNHIQTKRFPYFFEQPQHNNSVSQVTSYGLLYAFLFRFSSFYEQYTVHDAVCIGRHFLDAKAQC